jgi:hypothetical protein
MSSSHSHSFQTSLAWSHWSGYSLAQQGIIAPVHAALASRVLSKLTVPDARLGDPDAAQAGLSDRNVLAKLQTLALQASSGAGISSLSTIVATAAADHQAAESIISGAIINDHTPVYVVQMTGGPFTATQAAPGASAPQGNVLTLTLDAQTYRLTDISFTPNAPDLTQIGSPIVNLQ